MDLEKGKLSSLTVLVILIQHSSGKQKVRITAPAIRNRHPHCCYDPCMNFEFENLLTEWKLQSWWLGLSQPAVGGGGLSGVQSLHGVRKVGPDCRALGAF